MTTPIYINNFNLLAWPRAMVAWLEKLGGCDVTIVDNASTYEPLLDWYRVCNCRVVRLDANMGHLAPWKSGVIARDNPGHYVVSDPDLDLSGVPRDVIDYLRHGLDLHPDVVKCGLGIETEGILDTKESAFYPGQPRWEAQFWTHPTGDGYYRADVDTTFALYKEKDFPGVRPALRADRPYVARHLPYYIAKNNISDEYRQYLVTAHWCSSSARCFRAKSTVMQRIIWKIGRLAPRGRSPRS